MSNVLDHEKQQQILALGRLGWTLRRIEEATGIRRETVSGYLRAAGVAVRGRGGQPKEWPPKPAITLEVSTDPGPSNRPSPGRCPPTLGHPRHLGARRVRVPASRTVS